MIFKGGTLRVVTPVTEDGNRPKIVNGMPVYKETHLPKSAMRMLQRQNDRLPNHLKKKIELLTDDYVEPQAVDEKPKGKPGPKPKQNAQTN